MPANRGPTGNIPGRAPHAQRHLAPITFSRLRCTAQRTEIAPTAPVSSSSFAAAPPRALQVRRLTGNTVAWLSRRAA
jgi:hypothetical protein